MSHHARHAETFGILVDLDNILVQYEGQCHRSSSRSHEDNVPFTALDAVH